MKTSLVWLVGCAMRVFETFVPAGVVRTGAVFQPRVGIGWSAGTAFREFPPLDPPGRNSPGIQMTSSRKARQESKTHRDFLSPQRLNSERCHSSTHKGTWTC